MREANEKRPHITGLHIQNKQNQRDVEGVEWSPAAGERERGGMPADGFRASFLESEVKS